jgi:CheY-like chemotaxis protein
MSAPAKILIVDDDTLMHMLYRHHLERAGFQVLTAINGREAVEVATRELPQLIFMDIMMPEVDGLTALRELKKSDATKAIPVIVITANVSEYTASRQEATMCGAAGFLSKPLSPTQMLDEIRRQFAP